MTSTSTNLFVLNAYQRRDEEHFCVQPEPTHWFSIVDVIKIKFVYCEIRTSVCQVAYSVVLWFGIPTSKLISGTGESFRIMF